MKASSVTDASALARISTVIGSGASGKFITSRYRAACAASR
jgi:hypothetical protein